MRVAVGSDHNGIELKREVFSVLAELGHSYEDFGCYDKGSVDYPDIACSVSEAIADGRFQQGILVCGTGIGMSMSANRIRGARAALCHDTYSAQRAREHTDANILCLGAWIVGKGLAKEIVRAYLEAEFVGGRHARRLAKLSALED
jgi:ribose 5-phosphate isomerase B